MNAFYFASMFLMLLLAMSFAMAPLLRREKNPSGGFANIALLAVLATLLLAIGLYAAIGRPDVATNANVQKVTGAPAQKPITNGGKKAASVDELVAGLEQRLQDDPGDAKGWLLLAKSYAHVGRHEDAVAAYDKAVELGLSDNVLEASLN
jgi:cytochrome c-type biogenesis protein CcmH